MKHLLFLIIIVTSISCSDSLNNDDELACIDSKIESYENQSTELEGFGGQQDIPQSISEFQHDDETYYFVDFGIAFDAPAFIYDINCEEQCQIQSLIVDVNIPSCSEYNESLSEAIKIWPTE